MARNDITLGISAIEAYVEEEVLDIGIAQTKNDVHPATTVWKNEEHVVSRINNKN